MRHIYLDNAASAPMTAEVFEVMKPYLLEIYGNPSSTHKHGRVLRNAVEQARKTIAQCLGAHPSEIFFTSGGTEADNTILVGAVEKFGIQHIISTQIEHHAITHTIEYLEKSGKVKAIWLQVDKKGNISEEELESVLATHPHSLVTLMHANNEIGTLISIERIGEICKKYDALFHSDTVQVIGQYAYDLQNTNVHFINGAAHKFYGPKGVGFMYLKQGFAVPSFIHGGGQERNQRAGTENVAGIVGMAYALEKCYNTLAEKNNYLWGLKHYMIAELRKNFPNIGFNGEIEEGKSIATVLNVGFDCGNEDKMLLFNLDIKGISVSGGSACTSGSNIGSHVLTGIQTPPEYGMNAIRFSFGIQNTKEEIDYTLEQLKEILKIE